MARRQVGLKRQALISDLLEKVEKKEKRQLKRNENLTEDFLADRFSQEIFEKPNFDKMTSKQAREIIKNANDYLSRKGNISKLSNNGFGWSSDVNKLKRSLREKNIGDLMDEAFRIERKREITMQGGKLHTIKTKDRVDIGNDPGIVPIAYEIGNNTYGYKGKKDHSRLIIQNQSDLNKAILRQKNRKELFTTEKIMQAKENYLKTLASELGLDYKADKEILMNDETYKRVYDIVSSYSNAQFFYMYKTSSVFDYNFWYSSQEFDDWTKLFESESKMYDKRFKRNVKGYKHYIETLETYGINTDD